jgi:hypothetical protein
MMIGFDSIIANALLIISAPNATGTQTIAGIVAER